MIKLQMKLGNALYHVGKAIKNYGMRVEDAAQSRCDHSNSTPIAPNSKECHTCGSSIIDAGDLNDISEEHL